MRRTRQAILLCGLAVAVTAMVGCDAIGYFGYLLAPAAKTVKVPAEFDGLVGKTVAIVIYSDVGVQYRHPYARLGISLAVSSQLKKNVKGIKVVSPQRTVAYQDEHIEWEHMDRTKIGRDLGADYVLYIALDEYTMREPGSLNLYRGRISAQAGVYETAAAESKARLWHGDQFRVVYPAHAPTGELGRDDSQIRYETEKRLADMLAKKFYKHEVPVSE